MENIAIFKEKPFFSKKNLDEMGYSWYQIDKLLKANVIKQINCHLYESNVYDELISDFNYVNVLIPEGVVCRLSASYYYGYTNFLPQEINVAIPSDKKINQLPVYPPIKLFYPKGNRYSSDIVEINTDIDHFKIYSREKTVCDFLINKTKIDTEEIKNVLVGYVNDPKRDLNKLYKLATKLKCIEKLRIYMEVLL